MAYYVFNAVFISSSLLQFEKKEKGIQIQPPTPRERHYYNVFTHFALLF